MVTWNGCRKEVKASSSESLGHLNGTLKFFKRVISFIEYDLLGVASADMKHDRLAFLLSSLTNPSSSGISRLFNSALVHFWISLFSGVTSRCDSTAEARPAKSIARRIFIRKRALASGRYAWRAEEISWPGSSHAIGGDRIAPHVVAHLDAHVATTRNLHMRIKFHAATTTHPGNVKETGIIPSKTGTFRFARAFPPMARPFAGKTRFDDPLFKRSVRARAQLRNSHIGFGIRAT